MEVTDAQLWARAVGGEADSFGIIFDRHAKRVYSHCFRLTANTSMAEDLMSIVFLEAWRRRADVVLSRDSALPWLLGVANNVCRNGNRSIRRYKGALGRLPVPKVEDRISQEVVERLDAEERMRSVLRNLDALSDDDKDVLTLCVWQHLSYEEAAVALGVAVGTVQSRLSRARQRLRNRVEAEQHVPNGHITTNDALPLQKKEA